MSLRRKQPAQRSPARSRGPAPLILVLDNYDSFVYNLVQYLGEQGARVRVARNDAIDIAGMSRLRPDGILISPGPGDPRNLRDFGVCADAIRVFDGPVLGVCLGHQGIGAVLGAKVVPAKRLVHGKQSRIAHDGKGVLSGLPSPLFAGRYHSLALSRESVKPPLVITATAEDGEVMGVRHVSRPVEGVQFHPESVLTPDGMTIVRNFVAMARGARS
jgi:anthranilate synthase/aminodeoxychorismate synthase-like glutamine amidotransferase